jgi:hypothetical protein
MDLETLLELWATKYEVGSVLERAVGRGTPLACAGLAARGTSMVVVVDDTADAGRVQAAYGAKADAKVAGKDDADLPKSDLVLVHGGPLEGASNWPETLTALGKHATKLIVVAVDNPGAWSAQARALMARVTHGPNGHGGWGRTDALAPVLWALGRVREHAFLDVPPLGVRSPKLASRVAPRHAFVVDVTPRSPQARRRLRLST